MLYDKRNLSELEKAALEFHGKYPHVYQLVCRFAEQAIRRGYDRYGIAAIWERVRWEISMGFQSNVEAEDFKMPNNHRATYSRMWLNDHPEHPKFFQICRLRSKHPGPVDKFGRDIEEDDEE